MGSEHPEQMAPQTNGSSKAGGEDDLLGVIADVERQLESLKSHRTEREQFRQQLESREQELAKRDREITLAEDALKEKWALMKSEGERHDNRLRDVENAESELTKRRDKLESDFAALADEQRRASEVAARESAEIKAMSVALEQREQRFAEHAANISRQRETFEGLAAELARRQETAAAEAAELEKARDAATELTSRLEESERQGTSRIAELDQVRQRAVDLERRATEATRAAEEARRQLDDQGSKLADQLRVSKDELKRAGEAQSALMAELAQRDKAAGDAKREIELLKAEAARRQAGLTENETRVADFKRQLIERDARIQELSTKLASATGKFREVSQALQEQGALSEQSLALQEELKKRDRLIAELKAAGASNVDSTAHKADIEALQQQLQQMQAQLQDARNSNRELKTRLASDGPGPESSGIPEEVGETIMTRWRRLRLMRSLLQDQGEKLREASEAVRTRYAEAGQILAQRDQLAQARASMSTVHEKLQKLQARAAVGKASVAMFYLVGALAGMAGLAWAVSGEVAPARFAARAVINADTRGRQTSDNQISEWQKYIEAEVRDPRMHEVAAERMARAGIVSLSSPGQLSQRIERDFIADTGVTGSLKLELRGDGKAKTIRELDTFVTTLVSQANATKERRPDGLGVLIAEKPNADAGPIESSRATYAAAIFGLGCTLCLTVGGFSYSRLARAKVRIEEEQNIDAILDDSNWKRAEAALRQGRS